MVNGEIVSGQLRSWSLVEKLGEGDAGEVFRVESLLDQQSAILKRPYRSAFTGEINRQAAQIASEGQILKALNGLSHQVDWPLINHAFSLHVPQLMDRSKPGTEFSDRFFIVLEAARGVDLQTLARIIHLRQPDQAGTSGGLEPFARAVSSSGQIPRLVILRALVGTLDLLKVIHTHPSDPVSGTSTGVIWNDIKPDHLFWDPIEKQLTIIDWGNSQFLDPDGSTPDFRFTRASDYSQFIQTMGSFLNAHTPDLYKSLEWPDFNDLSLSLPERTEQLRGKIADMLTDELYRLQVCRQREANIVLSSYPKAAQISELEQIRQELLLFGENPDHNAAQLYYLHLGSHLVAEKRLNEFPSICLKASQLPGADLPKWQFLEQLSQIAIQQEQAGTSPETLSAFSKAIQAGLKDDWLGLLWLILSRVQEQAESEWLKDIYFKVRQLQLGIDANLPTPYTAIRRVLHSLQTTVLQVQDRHDRTDPGEVSFNQLDPVLDYNRIIQTLKDEIIPKWVQVDPDPPDSGLDYSDIDRLLLDLGELQPAAYELISQALEQPRVQIKNVLDAWGRKEFDAARRGLRIVLLWDPDRRRVFQADQAIHSATGWLETIQKAPRRELTLQEYIAPLELEGRELRNQVGSARWLDLILETLTKLRKGANPADLLYEKPELKSELPWLIELEPPRPVRSLSLEPVRLERMPHPVVVERTVRGVQEGRLGESAEIHLTDSLDTWVPEARGSSARVFAGNLRTALSPMQPCALKIMRADRVEYGLPLFREELQVLALMRDVPGVTGMMEFGFIRFDQDQNLPSDAKSQSANLMTGDVTRYAPEEIITYLGQLDQQAHAGWLPYLALQKYSQADNILNFCDIGYTHGHFLPMDALLSMTIQICDILDIAHSRNIVYRDHKILHYYWLEQFNGIFMIDWNVAKRHPHGLSAEERQFDLVQFGARALHHIFTGRPAPGALPMGPTRPDEIDSADHAYRAQWTYDDQRLPTALKDILEKVLAGGYTQVRSLRYDLLQVYLKLTAAGSI